MRLLLFLVNWGNWSSEILNNDSWLLSKSVGEVSLISNSKAHTLLPTTSYIFLSLRRWLKAMSLRLCCAQELGLYSLIDRNTSNAPSALNLTSSRNFWAGGKSHWFPSAHTYIPPKGLPRSQSFFYANSAVGLPAPAPLLCHTRQKDQSLEYDFTL